MRLGVLFSGGKDSCFATYLAKKQGYKISCLISIVSKNKDSYMFHTPAIERVNKQAESMNIPLIIQKTIGKKEIELNDLEKAIKTAIKKYKIQGIVTGAVESVYQASRIQKICNKLDLECFNPLWQKNQIELLNELIKNKFKIIITAVAAYPLDDSWLGREINPKFIKEVEKLQTKYKINPAGEGGEFETFVINCPLFNNSLKIKNEKSFGEKNSWRLNIEL
jgi:asparagine synthase (glutamine-hydrolysing)